MLTASPLRLRPRTVLVLVAFLGVGLLVFMARAALTPFLVGIVLAYIINPAVRRVEVGLPFSKRRPQAARVTAVIMVYLGGLALVTIALAAGLPPLFEQVNKFFTDFPSILDKSQVELQQRLQELQQHVPPEIQRQIDEAINRMGASVASTVQDSAVQTLQVAVNTFSVLLGIGVVPVWLFFVLKDRERFSEGLYRLFPASLWPDVQAIVAIVDRVLSSYVRAQLFLGMVIGVVAAVGLTIMHIPFALVLGLIAGITEMIPVVGPILGSVAGIVVTLATMPDMWPWVVLFYFVIQQVENNLLVPRIQGQALALHPAIIMVLLVAASELGGFFGMLVAAPLAAVCRDVFLYLYRRLSNEAEARRTAASG